ncbi:guanine deaminase-like [Saccoglossus kowalevskii]
MSSEYVPTKSEKKQFMARAIELSFIGSCEKKVGEPFGAVIVKDGKIIGEGYNMMMLESNPTSHGETVCIRNTCGEHKTMELAGCHIYSSTEPCVMCCSSILLTG